MAKRSLHISLPLPAFTVALSPSLCRRRDQSPTSLSRCSSRASTALACTPVSATPSAHYDRALVTAAVISACTIEPCTSQPPLFTAAVATAEPLLHLHYQFRTLVPLIQLVVPCPSSWSFTEPYLAISELV